MSSVPNRYNTATGARKAAFAIEMKQLLPYLQPLHLIGAG